MIYIYFSKRTTITVDKLIAVPGNLTIVNMGNNIFGNRATFFHLIPYVS